MTRHFKLYPPKSQSGRQWWPFANDAKGNAEAKASNGAKNCVVRFDVVSENRITVHMNVCSVY